MKTTREFCPADRYAYDFGICSSGKGFAQVDTGQDAWYFGTWANPEKLAIVSYCEGDVTLLQAEDPEEFAAELRAMKKWTDESGCGFKGIDPMCVPEIEARFRALGLGDLLH